MNQGAAKIKVTLLLLFVLNLNINLLAQSVKLYFDIGVSEQIEFLKGKDSRHGQTLSFGNRRTYGLELNKAKSIFQLGYTKYDVAIPFDLRYLNHSSTKYWHTTSDGNTSHFICFGYGRKISSKKFFSLDIFSGLNFGLFNNDIKSYKNPKSRPPQRIESYTTINSWIDSSLIFSSASMGYFTSKVISSIPLNFNFNFQLRNFGLSIIPFFELGLNNFFRLEYSYYIPPENIHGYAVSKSNGTNYGINFRASYSINFQKIVTIPNN